MLVDKSDGFPQFIFILKNATARKKTSKKRNHVAYIGLTRRTMSDDSSSEYESTSSLDAEPLQPVFIKRDRLGEKKTIPSEQLTEVKLNVEKYMVLPEEAPETLVDDTDDVDPEREYDEWKEREKERYERDMLALKEREDARENVGKSM